MSNSFSQALVPREDKTMDVEMVQSAETGVLRLKGSWTIERAHELKQALVEALKGDDPFVIDLKGLAEADLSCLQLLCSAHRTSLRLGKQLELNQEKSGAFKRVVRDAGFVRTLGCHQDPHKSCLWVGGWES
jgi:ABC-type transporter Mla MlaB component